MKALANQKSAESPSSGNKRLQRTVKRSGKYVVSPFLVLQRKTCACGGHCPRCQQKPSKIIQPKLKIGAPNDKYEQEADRVADQVMRMPEPNLGEFSSRSQTVQRKCTACTNGGSTSPNCAEEELRRKPLAASITPFVQRDPLAEREDDDEMLQAKGQRPTPSVAQGIQSQINSMRGGGQPIPTQTRTFFESRFGTDFSQVHLHTGSQAALASGAIHAQAFTVGQDIAFGVGQYAPETSEGKRLLAHELTHVVQQTSLNPNNAMKTLAFTPNAYPDIRKPATFDSISRPIIQSKARPDGDNKECPDTAVLSSSYPIKFQKSYFDNKYRTWLRLMTYIKVGPKASYKSCIHEKLKVEQDTCGTKGGFGLLRNGGVWGGKQRKGRKACAGTKHCFPVGRKGAKGHTGPNIFTDRHTTNLPFSLLKGSRMNQCTIKCLQCYTCGGKKLTGKFYVTRNFKAITFNKKHVTVGIITKVKA